MWFAAAFALHANMIRMATGARPVTRKEEPKLYNIVENLAISAGLPMPRVEIIRSGALNAYASGLGPDDAVVAVTRGLMRALTDEELEAVLAHEMTHIKNHDVRLMVVATCFAGGLTLLGDGLAKLYTNSSSGDVPVGLVGHRSGSSGTSDEEAVGGAIAVLISLAIAVLFFCMAHLFALIIHFAISRAREFMADAGAVELTKNPDALIAALNKISGNDEIPGLNANVKAMMISSSLDGFFATHPPIETRVMALQQFAGGRIVARAPNRTTASSSNAGFAAQAPASAVGFAGGRATFGRKRTVNA
jgi:heat shock protein HtpX